MNTSLIHRVAPSHGQHFRRVAGKFFTRHREWFTGSDPQPGSGPAFSRVNWLACFLSKKGLRCSGRFAQPFPPAWSLNGPAHRGIDRCPAAPTMPLADARLPAGPQGQAVLEDDAAGSRTGFVARTESGAGKPIDMAARTVASKDDAAGRRTGSAAMAGPRARQPTDAVPRIGAKRTRQDAVRSFALGRLRARMHGGAGRASGRPRGFFVSAGKSGVLVFAHRRRVTGAQADWGSRWSLKTTADVPSTGCGNERGKRHPAA